MQDFPRKIPHEVPSQSKIAVFFNFARHDVLMRVYHLISKLIGDVGQKNDYHSWQELVEISKNVKFEKDRFTTCEDMNFQKSQFCMKTFVGRKFPKVFI